MLPNSLPNMAEVDEMLRRQTRVVEALNRIKDVVITQQHALAEQRNRDEANKVSSDFGEDGSGYSDKADGAGGFAGPDSKKRRGVCIKALVTWIVLTFNREMHRLDAATAAIEQKLRSGGGDRMAPERSVMRADFVRISQSSQHVYMSNMN